jgi:dTDP-4-amino-4,6-dideoxygalactose transaminase
MEKLAIEGGAPVRTRPWPAWPEVGEEDARAVADVVLAGRWGSLSGGRANDFALAWARRHDCEYGVPCASGTAALEIALRGAGVQAGDEVIIPPYTFIATAAAVLLVNAVPVFADVDETTGTLDPAALEAAITPRTRAIMPVHVTGLPADMDGIVEVARRHSLRVVEDAAQAHGASWRGRGVGSWSDCGTFSFQASKNLNAGEGGAVVTNDRDLYERAWSFHNVGRPVEGSRHQTAVLGWNYRLTEMQAALLQVQMERWPEQMGRRTAAARVLDEGLASVPGITPQRRDERVTEHAYHLYMFRYDPEAFGGLPREAFFRAVRAEGVPVYGGYSPLYQAVDEVADPALFPDVRGIDYSAVRLPATERLCAQACWLSQNVLLDGERGAAEIVEAVRKVRGAVTRGYRGEAA